MFSLRSSLLRTSIAAGAVGLALLVPTSLPAHAQESAQVPEPKAGPRAAVTWQGWRGVHFAIPLTAAHDRLGGDLLRVGSSGGCGDVLTTRTGTLDGIGFRHGHAVATIRVKKGIGYPLGVNQAMKPQQVVRVAKGSDFILRTKRVVLPDDGHYSENRVVGPSGRTLYFSYVEGSGRIDRMGVSANRRIALEQMELNGC